MDLKFKVMMIVGKPVHEVFEAVADPKQLSSYFTTGGASGRLEEGKTVTWDFHDFPGAFPVTVLEADPPHRVHRTDAAAAGHSGQKCPRPGRHPARRGRSPVCGTSREPMRGDRPSVRHMI